MIPKERLLLFTRYPEIGTAKTRLIPALGKAGAAALHRELTEHTLTTIRQAQLIRPFDLEIRYEGGDTGRMLEWLGGDGEFRPQLSGVDLGSRMKDAFEESFNRGYDRVVLIGSDCPGLTPSIIEQAFRALSLLDLVLGPAIDGGYYLIGLRRLEPLLFRSIPWATESVLSLTKQRAASCELSVGLLTPLTDVDRPQDLPIWETSRNLVPDDMSERITAVIPVLNEENLIGEVLDSVYAGHNVEAVVVDGGSNDNTMEVANQRGATVFSAPRGRARQMNAGAMVATGYFLLFLHGDTRLPKDYDSSIRQILANHSVAAGAFRLGIDDDRWSLGLIENLANWRSKCLNLPYGDQGIFVRKDCFIKIVGFPELPLLEDVELVRLLAKEGDIIIAPGTVVTSARRWQGLGILSTTIINQLILLGYWLGVSPNRLARLYHNPIWTSKREFSKSDRKIERTR